jgi:hypothetical protein
MGTKIYNYTMFVKLCYNSGKSLTFKQIYNMYLKTDRWHELQQACFKRDNHRCRMCNAPAECAHHRVYPEILGTESVEDLTSLCHKCHKNFHFPPGVDDVRIQFFGTLADGKSTDCPVCRRYAKYELRPLNATMARSLIWLVDRFEKNGGQWINVPEEAPSWLIRTNQHTTLAKWGLIERKANHEDKTKKHTGYWKPLELGIKFAKGLCAVPYKVCLWDDTKIGETEETITVQEAILSGGFNYSEIIKSPDVEVAEVIKKKKVRKKSTVKFLTS